MTVQTAAIMRGKEALVVQEALKLLSQAQIIKGALREVVSVVDERVVADANSVLAGIENLAGQLSIQRTPLHEQIATRASDIFSPALGQLRASVTGGDFSGIQEDALVLEDLYGEFLEDLDQRLEPDIEKWPPEAWSLRNFISSQNREYKQNRELRGGYQSSARVALSNCGNRVASGRICFKCCRGSRSVGPVLAR